MATAEPTGTDPLKNSNSCYEFTLPNSILDWRCSDGNSVFACCFDRYTYRVVV